MDLKQLLQQKKESVVEEIIRVKIAPIEREIKQHRNNYPADLEKLETLLKEFASVLYPNRMKQIDRQLADGSVGERILVVCDMAGVPYSFDILVFLFVANRFRIEKGCKLMDIAFVAHASEPGIANEEIQENFASRYRTLIHNLGIQATRLLNCIGNIHLFDNRQMFVDYFNIIKHQVSIFPQFYNPNAPLYKTKHNEADLFCYRHLIGTTKIEEILNLRAPGDEVKFAERWLRQNSGTRIPITVTLRQLTSGKSRNTNLKILQQAITRLSHRNIKFVIIPDYATAYTECAIKGNNVVICNEAVLSLPFRVALYESSSFNIFGSNGPMCIGPLSRIVKYLVINLEQDEPTARMKDLRHASGLKKGKPFWGAGEFQRLIWEPETASVLVREINSMYDDLLASEQLLPTWQKTSEQS